MRAEAFWRSPDAVRFQLSFSRLSGRAVERSVDQGTMSAVSGLGIEPSRADRTGSQCLRRAQSAFEYGTIREVANAHMGVPLP